MLTPTNFTCSEQQIMQSNQSNKNKNLKKKEMDEEDGIILPSQKNNDGAERSPSSKFSNDHFQQLESNIPLVNDAVSSPVKKGISNKVSEPLSSKDAALIKLQKQLEYKAELEQQQQAKIAAEKERIEKELEMERREEERAKQYLARELEQLEKEKQEKLKKEKGIVRDPIKTENDAKAANVTPSSSNINNKDLKEDLFGDSNNNGSSTSEKRRGRRSKNSELTIDAPSSSTPNPSHPSAQQQLDSNVNTEVVSSNLPAVQPQQTPQIQFPPLNLSSNTPSQQPFTLDNNLLQHIHQEMVGQGILSYLLGQLAVMKQNNMEVLNANNLTHLQPLNISNNSILPVSPNLNLHKNLSATINNNIISLNNSSIDEKKNELFGGSSPRTSSLEQHLEDSTKEVHQNSSTLDTSIDHGDEPLPEQSEKKPKRRRKKKPSLEEELGNTSPRCINTRKVKAASTTNSSVEEDQDVSSSSISSNKQVKSKRVFKLNKRENENQQDEDPTNSSSILLSESQGDVETEQLDQIAARPKRSSSNPKKSQSQQQTDVDPSETNGIQASKPSRSKRVFNINNNKHESSPVLAGKSLSDDEYHNLDSD